MIFRHFHNFRLIVAYLGEEEGIRTETKKDDLNPVFNRPYQFLVKYNQCNSDITQSTLLSTDYPPYLSFEINRNFWVMVCPEGLDIVDRQALCVKSPYNFLLILKHLVSVCSSDIKVLLIELFLNKWITLFSLISFLPFAFNLASSLPMYIIVLLLSLLLYNSLFLSVRNALGEMWFFLLLFKMDGWFFCVKIPFTNELSV